MGGLSRDSPDTLPPLSVSPQRSLSLSGPALSVSALRSLCRALVSCVGPQCSLSGPTLSVSGPGSLCVGSAGPQLRSMCRPFGPAGPQLRSACHPRREPQTLLFGGKEIKAKDETLGVLVTCMVVGFVLCLGFRGDFALTNGHHIPSANIKWIPQRDPLQITVLFLLARVQFPSRFTRFNSLKRTYTITTRNIGIWVVARLGFVSQIVAMASSKIPS